MSAKAAPGERWPMPAGSYGRMVHDALFNDCPGCADVPTTAADDGTRPFATYRGGKGSAGTAERIIRLFPPHSMYVEGCLGNGTILRTKTPALQSIGIEENPEVAAAWRRVKWPGLVLVESCVIAWLEKNGRKLPADALVYVDPPYPWETRSKRHRHMYGAYEWPPEKHDRLLAALDALGCSVFVSTYDSPKYRERLGLWNRDTFQAGTRGGARTECVYWRAGQTNRFGVDVRFVGRDYRERERIKKKAARWVARLKAMPEAERSGILSACIDAYGEGIRK